MPPAILHVIPFLWSGAGAVLTRLCESQRRMSEVAIVTTGRSENMSDWPAYRRRLRNAGVTHHRIDLFHRDAPTFWSSVEQLAALLRQLRPSIVHAHAGVPAAAAAIARNLAAPRTRLIGQMYSWGPDRPDWMNAQDAWGFGRADRVVCSARAYWDLLVAHGVPTRKLVYLPWGLPLEELTFRGAKAQERSGVDRQGGGNGPILGFVGRIEPRKGQLELVEMLARVRRRLPNATLELVGPAADESYAQRVRTAIDAHGLDKAVTLHARVPRVVPFLNRWDLFASLSADEGQGMAVLEAMAVGVPVVARTVAGIEDFLTDGRTGVAIGRGGSASAARAVIRAIENPRLQQRVVAGARRLVQRRYSWERMLAGFDRLYAGSA
jgi:glycosyltransferase involved in cell wall biosynthesis